MEVVKRSSALWDYLPQDLKELIEDGEQLLDEASDMKSVSDYSFLVFTFAKTYEGFLKKLFWDLQLIDENDFYSDDIRIGRILNPNYIRGEKSVYQKLAAHEKGGQDISQRLWKIWRKGRNRVFHYFPKNFRKLTYRQAREIVFEFAGAMDAAIKRCGF